MNNKISIIIPAYNAQKTIERCIKSISNAEVEIIVVIDGSTDETLKICNNLKKDISNLRIIQQENKGAYEARKVGTKNANGNYIMFLDSDDIYETNIIERMEELINKYNNPDIIRFRYRKIPDGYEQYKYNDKDEIKIEKQDFISKVYPMFIEGYMLNSLWTNCIKKELIQNINFDNEDIRYGEDLLVNYQLFSKANNVVFVNDILYNYIYNPDSSTSDRTIKTLLKHLEDSIFVYSLLYQYIAKWNINTEENVKKVNNRLKKETNTIIKLIKNKIV